MKYFRRKSPILSGFFDSAACPKAYKNANVVLLLYQIAENDLSKPHFTENLTKKSQAKDVLILLPVFDVSTVVYRHF